jgi:glycosyltransferase involved in cell wall biosynthesis
MGHLLMRSLAILSSQAFSIVNFRGSLISSLSAEGVRIFALAPDYDNKTRDEVKNLGAVPIDISMRRAGFNPFIDLLDMFRLCVVLRKLQPDVMLGYFIKPVIFGMTAGWLAGVPFRVALIEGLGFVFTSSTSVARRALKKLVSGMYRLALLSVDRVVFLNKDDIHDFVSNGLVDSKKVANLQGIGVNLAYWAPAVPVTTPVTFLLAARLLREKGILEYVAAARIVKTKYPSARFLLLGALDVNPTSLTERELKQWVSEQLVEWPGHVDVRPWLAQSSVFVLPSYREGLPRSTQEAMAMARPIITTDVPGCRETVNNGVNGFLIPARNANALAHAMLKFIVNPDLIASMGKESRRIAELRFDGHQKTRTLIDILQNKWCNPER